MQVPSLDNFVRYEKISEPDEHGCYRVWNIQGVAAEGAAVYLWRNYNTFDLEHTRVPEGFVKQPSGYLDCDECVALQRCCPADAEARTQRLQNYFFGTKVFAEDYTPAPPDVPINAEVVFTHDNGGRPFKVIVDRDRKEISVYSLNRNVIFENKAERREYSGLAPLAALGDNHDAIIFTTVTQVQLAMNPQEPNEDSNEEPDSSEPENEDSNEPENEKTSELVEKRWNMSDYYDQHVTTLTYVDVWIPDGHYLTRNDGGEVVQDKSSSYYGNSVLARLTEAGKYLWVGCSVKEFAVCENDEILRYHSVVGNSDVPYPVAIGKNFVYFMLETPSVTAEPFAKYSTLSEEQLSDAYSFYYGHKSVNCVNDEHERVKLETKTIMKRDF